MKYLHLYIYFIIAIKLGFIALAMAHIYLKVTKREDTELNHKIEYWKERLEFVFVILMSILLIYIFAPRHDRSMEIEHEMKILLYLYGIITIITANWDVFFKEAKWFKDVQDVVGKD
jgi:hypothetical protein